MIGIRQNIIINSSVKTLLNLRVSQKWLWSMVFRVVRLCGSEKLLCLGGTFHLQDLRVRQARIQQKQAWSWVLQVSCLTYSLSLEMLVMWFFFFQYHIYSELHCITTQKTVLVNIKTYVQTWNMKLYCIWALWNVSIGISVTWTVCCMVVLQRPAESFGVMETIPAYGQQQSGGHLCWAAQVNIAVHLLWALFCYIWPILGSLSAHTRSNGPGPTATVLWPLHSWRSAWRGREAGECAARCWNWALGTCRTVNKYKFFN